MSAELQLRRRGLENMKVKSTPILLLRGYIYNAMAPDTHLKTELNYVTKFGDQIPNNYNKSKQIS